MMKQEKEGRIEVETGGGEGKKDEAGARKKDEDGGWKAAFPHLLNVKMKFCGGRK
jgi:hypothetical protein